MTARDEVLARIRRALADTAPDTAAPASGAAAQPAVGTSDAARAPAAPPPGEEVPRRYRTHADLDPSRLLDLLAERLHDYGSTVRRSAPGQVLAAVGEALTQRGARRVVVPPGLDLAGLAGSAAQPAGSPGLPGGSPGLPADVEILVDDGLSAAALDAVDGVITGAAVAIAETGTIVLDGSPGQGRRALSLVPDYHLCILHADQVVALVPEALARLTPDRPLTWISGPSATSDIELDRVQGVHGPRTLEVILVEPEPPAKPRSQRSH
jgi:L-lactate dehydrogenase complex protein LldG